MPGSRGAGAADGRRGPRPRPRPRTSGRRRSPAAWARSTGSGTSMPLSRQTSRIVWPSRPSTTRPSTSIRIARRDLRPLRALGRQQPLGDRSRSRGVSCRAAGVSGRGLDAAGRASRGERSGRPSVGSSCRARRHRDGLTDAGGARAADDVVVELRPEVSHPAGERRVARRSWSHRAAAAMSWREVLQEAASVGFGRPVEQPGRRSRTAGAARCGRGWSCRTPRRRRTSSGARAGPRRTCGRRRPRWCPSRGGRRPRGAASKS